MGNIHMGYEQGLAEGWQRDRGLHENAVAGLRLLAEYMAKKGLLIIKEATDEEDTGHRENQRSD